MYMSVYLYELYMSVYVYGQFVYLSAYVCVYVTYMVRQIVRMLTALIFIDGFLFNSTAAKPRIDLDIGPKFVPVKPPEVLLVFKGDDSSVRCQAKGNIQLHMKWSKSGGDLPARAKTLADGTLKLTSIQLEDAGEYVCTASVGNFGFIVGITQLIVGGEPVIPSESYALTHTFRVTGASV